jgi:signal peptidase I
MIGTSRGRSFLATLTWMGGSMAVALGLAFTVKIFLVEAFVVPTGALATTILGAHADVTCKNCGYQFPITMSDRYDRDQHFIPGGDEKEVVCRNCGHNQTHHLEGEPLRGDRILVDKTASPRRWDLAVFWYPPTGKEPHPWERPDEPRVTYVKRLVGLPGEVLQLADGDAFIDGRRLRKLPGQQEELWFPVYDSHQVPKAPERPLWQAQQEPSGWKVKDEVSFASEATEQEILSFVRPIDNWLSYNVPSYRGYEPPDEYVLPCSDVRLTCDLAEFDGDGGFGFTWKYGQLEIRAAVAASAEVSLTMTGDTLREDDEIVSEAPQPLAAGQRWAFACRDGRVYVEQDGRIVASRLVGSDRFEDTTAQSACHVGLFAERCQLRFSRAIIDRDVYYIPMGEGFNELAPGREYRLGADEYFMLGDNSAMSADSRSWGPAKEADMIGVVRAIFWPVSRWRAFP